MVLSTHHPWPCQETCLIPNLTDGLGQASTMNIFYISLGCVPLSIETQGRMVLICNPKPSNPLKTELIILKIHLVAKLDLNRSKIIYDLHLFYAL